MNKIYLEVHGDYQPYSPGTREDPPEYEQFMVGGIYHEGVRIDHILDVFGVDYEEIEKKCLEEIKE